MTDVQQQRDALAAVIFDLMLSDEFVAMLTQAPDGGYRMIPAVESDSVQWAEEQVRRMGGHANVLFWHGTGLALLKSIPQQAVGEDPVVAVGDAVLGMIADAFEAQQGAISVLVQEQSILQLA